MLRSTRRLLLLLLAVPVLVAGFGLLYQLGMARFEGQSRGLLQSIGWAAETLTTTGYGADSTWTTPVMAIYVMAVQFVGVLLAALVVPFYLIPFLEERFEARLPRELAKLTNHVIVYRHGPAVMVLIDELKRAKIPYVVVERNEVEARRLLEAREPVLHRSHDDGGLVAAHLGTARALITNDTDAENASITLAARQFGFTGEVLAMVEEPVHRQPMMLAGASGVFTPRHVLAAALADRASDRISPRISGAQHLGRNVQVAELQVAVTSSLVGKSLAELELGARTGTSVIGQWVEGRLRPATATTVVERRGILLAVGDQSGLERLATLAGSGQPPAGTGPILIAGYGEVGRKVAELLGAVGEEVTVIERTAGPDVTVVGSALDRPVLERAGVRSARAVVLALDHDAATLFATVIVRDLAPNIPIIARVNEALYVQRIHQAGASFALSISQVAGQILAHRLLGREIVTVDPQIRIMQVGIAELIGKHPRELDIRERTGCSVVCVERGDEALTHYPDDFRFAAGDTVYVCGSDEATERYRQEFASGA